MEREYKNVVFTKHALERMSSRSISSHAIWEVISHPDRVKAEKKDSRRYIKTLRNRRYFVVASYLPKENKYLVVSTWVRGEDDKESIAWILITLPFKLLWKLIKVLVTKISSL